MFYPARTGLVIVVTVVVSTFLVLLKRLVCFFLRQDLLVNLRQPFSVKPFAELDHGDGGEG